MLHSAKSRVCTCTDNKLAQKPEKLKKNVFGSHSGSDWLSLPLPGIYFHFIQSLLGSKGSCSALSAAATMTLFLPVCTTAGCTGCDRSHLCTLIIVIKNWLVVRWDLVKGTWLAIGEVLLQPETWPILLLPFPLLISCIAWPALPALIYLPALPDQKPARH